MQQRSEDTWVPTFDDEADDDAWSEEQADGPDSTETEDDAGTRDRRRSRRQSAHGMEDERVPRLRAVLGIFLVVLLGVSAWWGVRALLLPAASTPTPAAVWTPAALATPLPSSTPAVAPAQATQPLMVASPAAQAEILVGQQVRVAGTDQQGIRLRSEAGTGYDTLLIVEEGVVLQVIDGPQEVDGYTWWQLETSDGTVGWAVQDWLEPAS